MDAEIVGLKELISVRFDGTDERLDSLTMQVMKTNGRLQEAERHIAVLQDRLYLSAGAILLATTAYIAKLAVGLVR